MTKGRWQKKYGENNDKEGDEDSGNDNLEPVVHVMGVSAWPGHADTMVTILNWKVGLTRWWWGRGRIVVVFDTMTMRQGSAIMSEGQFTLTDDTRRAATRQQPPIWYRWIARDCDDHESDAGNDDGRPDDNDHNVNDNEGSLLWLIIPGAARAFYLAYSLPTTHLPPQSKALTKFAPTYHFHPCHQTPRSLRDEEGTWMVAPSLQLTCPMPPLRPLDPSN